MASYDFDASPDFDILLEEVSEIGRGISNRNTDLEWLWFDVRNNIIDVVTRTIGLGRFSDGPAVQAATLTRWFFRTLYIHRRHIALHRDVRILHLNCTSTWC